MDYDRLKDVVAKSYRLTELHLEIDKLVAVSRVRCPGMLLGDSRGHSLLAGHAVRHRLSHGGARRTAGARGKGIGAIENERFGCCGGTFTPFFDPTLMGFMQKKYGAVSVADMPLDLARG